jgi:hypothetical protein
MNFSKKICVGVMTLTIGAIPGAAQACRWGKGVVSVRKNISADLRYSLIDKFGPLRSCNFDCAGPCRITPDIKHVEQIFAQIRQDAETFSAIAKHLGLLTTRDFSFAQKEAVYGEYEKLACGMTFEHQPDRYRFKLLGSNGLSVDGEIKQNGEIVVTEKKLAGLICPL